MNHFKNKFFKQILQMALLVSSSVALAQLSPVTPVRPVRPPVTPVRPVGPLPILKENEKGFVLNPLSQKALSLHLQAYKAKRLILSQPDPETFERYQELLHKLYPPGAFQLKSLYVSPEILEARREAPLQPIANPRLRVTDERVILKYKMIDPRLIKRWGSKNGLVDIFVPQNLYDNTAAYDINLHFTNNPPTNVENGLTVKAAIDRYMADLQKAGYWTQLYKISGGTPVEIKNTLVADQKWGLVGSVFIGSTPSAWYRNASDFDGVAAEFPMDLYYMDLDGVWADANHDGRFESHTGDVEPEIWVGHIGGNVPVTGKSEGQIIAEYLSRNHFFRTRDMVHFPQRLFAHSGSNIVYRALAFHDDDWADQGASQYLNGITFNNRILVNDSVGTNATNYLDKISEVPGGYFYLHLMAHSSPTSHAFKTGSAWSGGSLTSNDLNAHLRRAHFYNLFNCSGAKFTVNDYLGGMYVLGNDYGLGAIGSAKTGSMLNFDVYYALLAGKLKPDQADLADDWDVVVGKPANTGTAFLKWFRYIAKGGFNNDEKAWHYGMVYIGDPTLYANWDLN